MLMMYNKTEENLINLLMNKLSQIVKNFIQQIIHTKPNVFIEEYQYVVDDYGIIRFID